MKKVLVSPGYGAGFATWADDHCAKALAEDQELIAMVEAGEHLGHTSYAEIRNAGAPVPDGMSGDVGASLRFAKRAFEIAGGYVYCGGVPQLEVQEVCGPYSIEEYDGSESLRTTEDWW